MKPNHRILVSTTSHLEGWHIDTYLGTVTSHVVAGSGAFSDFFASLSDVFGGRSQSYQKQLRSIKDEAIEALKREAAQLGANCVLGLKLDFDEISGHGKQMFMVSGIGTAVKASRLKREQEDEEDIPASRQMISQEELNASIKTKQYLRLAERNDLVFNSETMAFITNAKISELFPYVLRDLEAAYGKEYLTERDQEFHSQVCAYLQSIESEEVNSYLYERLKDNNQSPRYIYEIIGRLDLLDIAEVNEMLDSGEFEIKRRALHITQYDKPYYSTGDLAVLEEILARIQGGFPERGERITEKGMFSSKAKEYWKCTCGNKVEGEQAHCYACLNDIYGFKSDEVNPQKASIFISNRISVLREMLDLGQVQQ